MERVRLLIELKKQIKLEQEQQKVALRNFVEQITLSEGNQNQFMPLHDVTSEEAKKLNDYLGLDLTGYLHEIDNYGIKHVLKQHGYSKTEEKRGQMAITYEDFVLIPDIILNYDHVMYAGKKQNWTRHRQIHQTVWRQHDFLY